MKKWEDIHCFMNNIGNIHKSPAFTILVIIFTFIGIISSFQYSKYKNSLVNESFKYSSGISMEGTMSPIPAK